MLEFNHSSSFKVSLKLVLEFKSIGIGERERVKGISGDIGNVRDSVGKRS